MILEKLLKIELKTKYNIQSNYRKIKTINAFKELLQEIDFSSEIIPMEDSERLAQVLTSLKGMQLNGCETKLVAEITEK